MNLKSTTQAFASNTLWGQTAATYYSRCWQFLLYSLCNLFWRHFFTNEVYKKVMFNWNSQSQYLCLMFQRLNKHKCMQSRQLSAVTVARLALESAKVVFNWDSQSQYLCLVFQRLDKHKNDTVDVYSKNNLNQLFLFQLQVHNLSICE